MFKEREDAETKDHEFSSEFKQKFTSAAQPHFHYEKEDLE